METNQTNKTLWYIENPARLILERRAMTERFPPFELRCDGSSLFWIGTLTSNLGNSYEIAVIYPDDFPTTPPKVYPLDPPIYLVDEPTGWLKHQFRDGSLCLFHPADRFFEKNTTAATVVALAAAWIFAYEQWRTSGVWAGDEAD